MNTGSLLKKPGESAYSRYRRFLIANRGCYKSINLIRNEIIQQSSALSKFSQLKETDLTPALAFAYELLVENKDKSDLIDSSVPRHYKPIKNCPKCSEISFHSNIFQLPWVSKCPIHNQKLVEKCVECGKEFPPSSKLLSNNCKSCGTLVNTKELLIALNKNGNYDFNVFKQLAEISNVDRKCYPEKILRFYRHASNSYGYINQNTAFYASVLLSNDRLPEKLIPTIKKLGLPIYKILKRTFNYKTGSALSELDVKKNEVAVHSLINKRVRKLLANLTKHELGTCRDIGISENKGCFACKVYALWMALLPYGLAKSFGFPHTDVEHYFVVSNMKDTLQPYNMCTIPDLQTSLSSIDESVIAPLPCEAAKLILSLQLWAIFIHVYNYQLAVDKLNKEGKRLFWTNFSDFPPAKGSRIPLFPFYLSLDQQTVSIEYPEILSKNIVISKAVNQLYLKPIASYLI